MDSMALQTTGNSDIWPSTWPCLFALTKDQYLRVPISWCDHALQTLLINSHRHGPLIRYVKLWVAHAPGMPGTFSLPPTSKETASLRSRHARAVMHVGIANPRCAGKTFPAHAQPTILHICQEAHYSDAKWASWRLKLPAVGGISAVIIVFQITGHSTFFNNFLMLIWQKIPKLRIIGHLWDYYSIVISGHISAGHSVTTTGKSAVMTLAVTSHQCQWHVSWYAFCISTV